MRNVLLLTCVLGIVAPWAAASQLDQLAIHTSYSEGDFDRVISGIDAFVQDNKTYSHDDSVFIAKHLAVVYTANPVTREKGKYYMHRLLELLPSAKIVDMYVSDEIFHIFERVAEEYRTRHSDSVKVARPAQTPGREPTGAQPKPLAAVSPTKPSVKPAPAREPANWKPYVWSGTLVGMALTGATFYVFFHPEETKRERVTIRD